MAKFHSASPREITSPFTREIISVSHSKACNNLYVFHSYSCNKLYISREISIEHPSVGLASLSQSALFIPTKKLSMSKDWNISRYVEVTKQRLNSVLKVKKPTLCGFNFSHKHEGLLLFLIAF